MSTTWYRCTESESLHRTLAEADACPGCLSVLPAPTRQRRHALAVVVQVAPSLPPPPLPSWATVSSLGPTPPASREVSPANLPNSPQPAYVAYPTPGPSQEHQHVNRGIRSARAASPSRHPFTAANSESPTPTPSSEGMASFLRYSANLLRHLNPAPASDNSSPTNSHQSSASEEGEGEYIMPPRPRSRPQQRRATLLPNIHTRRSAASTVLVPQTEPDLSPPTSPRSSNNSSITPNTSRASILRRLQDSTAMTERLHTRSQIATAERERAEAVAAQARGELAAAQAALEVARAERDEARGGRLAFLVRLRWLVAVAVIVGLAWWANRLLYGPEFEYILRRSREGLGP